VAFDTFEQAVDYIRGISEGFGPHAQEQWETLTRRVMVQKDGKWIKHYDLRMAQPFAMQNEAALRASEALLWSSYESIRVPVLVVRGERSDLLSADTAARMLARNPRAELHVVPGVGHAPTFMSDEQIEPVERFLVRGD
jgi:pimeloyl-ACP methyl ester carboxylesterase